MDREVRALRDSFITFNYSKVSNTKPFHQLLSNNFQLLYNGMYFSPEREFLEASITASQKSVNGQVRCRAYKGTMSVLGRSSETEKLYDMSESSMDEIGDFSPAETTGFINVSAIRLKKYGQMKAAAGERL
jgi:argininosuccinate synthase